MAARLTVLETGSRHTFAIPSKKINEGQDVSRFLVSQAYRDITTFLVQLNRAMFPVKNAEKEDQRYISPAALKLQALVKAIATLADQVPLDPGTHRFGNTAFRKWFALLEEKASQLLHEHLPEIINRNPPKDEISALQELQTYLLGSFGSAQRLDYGTGHELSFLAFLAGIWKLGGFGQTDDGSEERSIVLDVIDPYLALIRKLILKYSLEPAGSHGVWGLDDHSFIPYIFGSAQYGPSISDTDSTPTEGSSPSAPSPGGVIKPTTVAKERQHNLYFGAIGFIYDVKTGPFWEHSPTLFDISGVTAGWAKINKVRKANLLGIDCLTSKTNETKGMLKMYDAEVLSKFPVVQHFPFGSLFSFERDPEAKDRSGSVHVMNQPSRPRNDLPVAESVHGLPSTVAPWAKGGLSGMSSTAAPWAKPASQTSLPSRSAMPARHNGSQATATTNNGTIPTAAPWAKNVDSQKPNAIEETPKGP